MTRPTAEGTPTRRTLPKAPTGIQGLDELTGGGLPRGRPTLVCGSAGCGKTVLGIEFLVRGATEFGEPGALMAFEETAEELTANVRSLGFDLDELVRQKKLALDYVRIERAIRIEPGKARQQFPYYVLLDIVLNIGSNKGVQVGQYFDVLSVKQLKDPDSGRIINSEITKGAIQIVTVNSDSSVGKRVSGSVKPLETVKSQEALASARVRGARGGPPERKLDSRSAGD